MKPITKSVMRKLFKMKWRVFAISMVVSLAMAMFVMGLYSAVIFDHSMDKFIEDTNFPDAFITLSEPVEEAEVDEVVSSIEGVEAYSLRLKLNGILHSEGKNYQAALIGIEDPTREDISKLLLKDGEFFSDIDSGNVVSGMEHLGAKTGEALSFSTGGFDLNITVAGTVQTPEYMIATTVEDSSLPLLGDFVVLYMDLGRLQEITGYEINDILLKVEGDQREGVISELGELPLSKIVYQEDHPSVVAMDIGADKMRNMFPMFSVIFMIVGMISIFMTFYRIVMNDSKYIGVLMSLGYSRLKITWAYMTFGTILATIGSIFGILLGILFTVGIMSYTISMIGDIRVVYPMAPAPFLLGLLFSFGSVLVSVGIPIIHITRLSVREALDHKPKTKVLTVGSAFSGMSKTRVMGIRNTFRNPARTFLTILVVGMSIGISGSWIVMTDSAWGYMADQIKQDTWDLRVDFTSPMPNANVTSMLGSNSTEYVIPFAYMAGQISGSGGSEPTFIVASDRVLESRDFDVESGKLDIRRSVITNKLASELGVSVGDKITITVGNRILETTVGGVVFDILMQAVYLDRETASPLMDGENATSAFVKLHDKDNVEGSAAEYETIEGVSKVTVQDDIIDAMETTFGSAMSMLYFFFICLMIAMVVAASAIIISTMERDIEFATLETLGIPRSKVIGSMLIEIGILGFFSALVGLPFAYLFGKLFAIVMEDILYYFPVVFALSTMLITFGFGFLFIFGSSIFPIRYTGKMDVEKTIRERTAG